MIVTPDRLELLTLPEAIVLPDKVIKEIIDGKFIGQPVVLHDRIEDIYDVFESTVKLPGLHDVTFTLEYRKYSQENCPGMSDGLMFKYGIESSGCLTTIADIEYDRIAKRRFKMAHRYVEQLYRGRRGVGTLLFKQSEQCFQQMADQTQQRQRLEMSLSQMDVLKWAIKNGFIPDKNCDRLVQLVLQHSEQFTLRDVVDTADDVEKTNTIFPADAEDFSFTKAVRLHLYRIISPHIVQTEESLVSELVKSA